MRPEISSLSSAACARNPSTAKWRNALRDLAPATLKLDIVEIGQLPLYNQDLDTDPPAAWKAFRDACARRPTACCS